MEKVRGWVRSRPIIWMIGVALVALILGAAAGESGKSSLEDEKSELQHAVATAKSAQETAEEEASAEVQRVEAGEARILGKAEARAAKIVGSAKQEAEQLAGVEAQIVSKEAQLADVKSSLEGANEEAAKSTIPENGTFEAEVDFIPGTYRAPGGSGCYWATLNSADPNDIASNELGPGPQIAAINSPYFQTEGCGEWERIGE